VNNSEYKWIEDRLDPGAVPEPPEGLLEKIQDEIPRHLQVVPAPAEQPSGSWRLRLLAASVVMVILSGAVVYRIVLDSPTTLAERLARDTGVTAPETIEVPQSRPAKEVTPPLSAESTAQAPAIPAGPDEPIRVTGEVGAAAPAEEHELDAMKSMADELKVARQEVGANLEKKSEPGAIGSLEDDGSGRRDQDRRERVESGIVEEGEESIRVTVTSDSTGLYDRSTAPKRERSRELRDQSHFGEERMLQDLPAPSTGGTAEPNDAPYGDMFFRSYGTNPFIDTEDDTLSTFGLDVDTGSFTLARSYLDRGHLPPPEAIRVEEFVNYFDYGDPAPRRGEFTLVAEGAPSPFATGPRYQLVRFGIKAREISGAQRQPASLIFIVDVSGSMGRENRLGLVKQSLHLMLDQLDRDDRIGLVVYGSRGDVLLEPTTNKDAIRRAIDRLVPNGSTNAEEGLDLAYDLARRHFREGDINRLILCSDGVANVGRTGPESILERVRREADEGIELTTVGFGMGNYNDVLMEQLADQGDGSYAYVDSLNEARRIFVENLTGTLQTIASDAKVQVEFNPKVVSRYRLIGYENRDIADERFRDDTVDAGEIGAGHAVTALYEIKLHEGAARRQRLATLRLRYRSKATDRIVETAIDLSSKNLSQSWESSAISVQLSSLAAEFAEILKGSYWAKDADLDELYRRLRPVADELVRDEEVQDLLYLVDRARSLQPQLREYREQ
jgi:Ca-activated chloride channel family protein